MPGTAYSVAYYKPAKSPSLLAKRIADKDDPRADLSLSDFLAAAMAFSQPEGARARLECVSEAPTAQPHAHTRSGHA
jgi:hypothetical protein